MQNDDMTWLLLENQALDFDLVQVNLLIAAVINARNCQELAIVAFFILNDWVKTHYVSCVSVIKIFLKGIRSLSQNIKNEEIGVNLVHSWTLKQLMCFGVCKDELSVVLDHKRGIFLVGKELCELCLLPRNHVVFDGLGNEVLLDKPRAAQENKNHWDHLPVLFVFAELHCGFIEQLAGVGVKAALKLDLHLKVSESYVDDGHSQESCLESVVVEHKNHHKRGDVAFVVLDLFLRCVMTRQVASKGEIHVPKCHRLS